MTALSLFDSNLYVTLVVSYVAATMGVYVVLKLKGRFYKQ